MLITLKIIITRRSYQNIYSLVALHRELILKEIKNSVISALMDHINGGFYIVYVENILIWMAWHFPLILHLYLDNSFAIVFFQDWRLYVQPFWTLCQMEGNRTRSSWWGMWTRVELWWFLGHYPNFLSRSTPCTGRWTVCPDQCPHRPPSCQWPGLPPCCTSLLSFSGGPQLASKSGCTSQSAACPRRSQAISGPWWSAGRRAGAWGSGRERAAQTAVGRPSPGGAHVPHITSCRDRHHFILIWRMKKLNFVRG